MHFRVRLREKDQVGAAASTEIQRCIALKGQVQGEWTGLSLLQVDAVVFVARGS